MASRAPSSAMASWAPCTAMASRAPNTAMVTWAPCTAMASRAPSSAMASVVCSALEVPVLCSCPCLFWGASRAPTPPSPVELLRRGTRLPGGGSYVRVLLCVICSRLLCPYMVCFMSLLVKYVPAVFVSLCVNYPVYISPVFWVWFRLVYSLFPGVSVHVSPALMSTLKTIIWVYVLVCMSLFLPRVCTVTPLLHISAKQMLHFSTLASFLVTTKCIHTADMFCSLSTVCAWNRHWHQSHQRSANCFSQ